MKTISTHTASICVRLPTGLTVKTERDADSHEMVLVVESFARSSPADAESDIEEFVGRVVEAAEANE